MVLTQVLNIRHSICFKVVRILQQLCVNSAAQHVKNKQPFDLLNDTCLIASSWGIRERKGQKLRHTSSEIISETDADIAIKKDGLSDL